jgi:SAM-dependent methyltransferase
VDISAGMVAKAVERAQRKGIEDRVEFRVADAQDLPFDDDTFDVVMTESVTVLPPDKEKAASEYVRVTKPGGYVGLNETTWLKIPPPPEMVAYIKQDLSANAEPLSESGWVRLLQEAGLKDVVARTRTIELRDETRGIIDRYGCGGMLRVFWRILALYVKNPAYRDFTKEIKAQSGPIPRNYGEYAGYGIFVGKK